ncbi:MAG: hypothetical protein QXR24_06595, partial [Thermosphaera sp.]
PEPRILVQARRRAHPLIHIKQQGILILSKHLKHHPGKPREKAAAASRSEVITSRHGNEHSLENTQSAADKHYAKSRGAPG